MKLVFGHGATVNGWIVLNYGCHVVQQPSISIGVIDRDGVLRGAFVTTWRNENTAELHLYGRSSNDTWKSYFAWVFAQCHRLEVYTERTNVCVRRAAPKFGFKFEGVSSEFYGPGRSALRFYMTAGTCRWLRTEERNGIPLQIS